MTWVVMISMSMLEALVLISVVIASKMESILHLFAENRVMYVDPIH